MQKIFFIVIAILLYIYYDSTLGHHFMVTNNGNLIGQCTSNYEFLDLHIEAFNCQEDFDNDFSYIVHNCNYKGERYTLYELNSYKECKAVEKATKKGMEPINTRRKKIITTNFAKKRDTLFEGVLDILGGTLEHDPQDIRHRFTDHEKINRRQVRPISNLKEDDMDNTNDKIEDAGYHSENGTRLPKNANERRLQIYKEQNGIQ